MPNGQVIWILADTGVVSVAYELLLSAVVLTGMLGIGWAGKRLLGKEGIIEAQNKALAANSVAIHSVAECVKQHDERASRSMGDHASVCSETQKTVKQVHSAAVMACDVVERECRKREIDLSAEISRIRSELTREH